MIKNGTEYSVKKEKLKAPIGWTKDNYYSFKLPALHVDYLESVAGKWPIMINIKKEEDQGFNLEKIAKYNKQLEDVYKASETKLKRTLLERLAIYHLYQKASGSYRKAEDKKCKENCIYWINRYAWTLDPRLSNTPLPAKQPFILWKRQAHFIEMVEYWYRANTRWLFEKSRAVGASWSVIAWYVWHWLYTPGFSGGLGSQKQEFVDKSGFPGALFYKVRFLLDSLPPAMLPQEFIEKRKKYDLIKRINNPENGAHIVGDQGDNIGTGDRTSVYIVDEKASVENQAKVDSNLSLTTDVQGDISTPQGMNHFYEKRHNGKVQVYTMWWYYNPMLNPYYHREEKRKTTPWRVYQDLSHDEVTVAQNVEIDYACSVGGLFMNKEWIEAAVELELKDDNDDVVAGFDVAGGGKNDSVYVLRKGSVVYLPKVIKFDTPNEAALKVIDVCENDSVYRLNYDEDGLGVSVLGTFRTLGRPIMFKTHGIHGNASASDDFIQEEGRTWKEKVRNKRAELWCKLRKRFQRTYEHIHKIRTHHPEDLISIPNDRKLIAQLCAPLEKRTGAGKILVESKDAMRSRGVESPDRADAVVYSFTDKDFEHKYISNFDYTENSSHFIKFDQDFNKPSANNILSLYQTEDLRTAALVAQWYRGEQKLMILHELMDDTSQPEIIYDNLASNEFLDTDLNIANKHLFDGIEKNPQCQWYLYNRLGMRFKENYDENYKTGIVIANQMFKQNKIQVHTNCADLMFQMDKWAREEGTPDERFLLVLALCQLVNFLKKKRILSPKYQKVTIYGKTFLEKVGQD